jgi:hypothetical protein
MTPGQALPEFVGGPDEPLVTADWAAVETLIQCPRRFALKWVDEAPEDFEPVDAVLDGAVRDTIAWYVGASRGDLVPAESAIGEEFRRRWAARLTPAVRVVRAGDRVEAFAHRGELMVRRLFTSWPPVPALEVETVDRRYQLRLRRIYDLVVRVDLVGRDASGALHVIEIDTGTRAGRPASPEAVDRLHAAGVAVLLARKVEAVRLTRLRLTDGHRDEMRLTRFDAARFASSLADQVAGMPPGPDSPARPSVSCAWCGYRDQCADSGIGGRFIVLADLGTCTRCGSGLGLRKGRLGVFVTCERYPECRFTRDL